MDNTEQTVDDAFEMIGRAINRIGDADDIDVAFPDDGAVGCAIF
ncbi:MAG: hypothetical protein OXF79_12875 [Chloroflexi bacterium]|nr:hypothetical protein [Chloroflexota bacterium]